MSTLIATTLSTMNLVLLFIWVKRTAVKADPIMKVTIYGKYAVGEDFNPNAQAGKEEQE